ncbi:hypothetical protein E2C01_060283 [Portunus trituberculatus]|uniref:Uncharacterized protein n=1 Tax=Portunus trituberculatus TaxID=210409 RepID=A0A5B7HA13_PORTR|nr:hypothetical protein [Portunus trituberculatus]
MQSLGQAGPAAAASPEVEIVPASTVGPTTTTGGFHAPVSGTGKAVHSALGTFHTVYGGEIDDSHPAPMSSGQTPIWDIDGGVCHMAPMPSGQPLIPSHDFICGTGKKVPGAPGTFGSVYGVVEFGNSLATKMFGGLLPTENISVGVSYKAPMPGNQTRVPCVGVGVWYLASMPGGHPLPCSGLGHLDPDESVPGNLPLIQEASVEAGQPASVPGGSWEASVEAGQPAPLSGGNGVGQGLLAPMLVGCPFSVAGTCEDDEQEELPNQKGVFPFCTSQAK